MPFHQHKRCDPLVHLCQDVLIIIFTYLETQDVLNCSYVNHVWYNRIPTLSTTPWEELYLSDEYHPIEISEKPSPRSQYIKSICATSYSDIMLQNCINMAKITWKCQNIRRLTLYVSSVNDKLDFINILKTLGDTLRVLIMVGEGSPLSFFSILQACPDLHTLHYDVAPKNTLFDTVIGDDPSSSFSDNEELNQHQQVQFRNMTCLSLDFIIPSILVNKILKRCPNLRCVRVGNVNPYPHWYWLDENVLSTNKKNTDLTSILQLCPHVEYIEYNRRDSFINDDDFMNLFTEMSWWKEYGDKHPSLFSAENHPQFFQESSPLRVLKFFGVEDQDYSFSDVAYLLKRSQNSLQILHLEQCELMGLLEELSMTQLREFHCRSSICSSDEELISFIGRCSMLERFALDVNHDILQSSQLSMLLIDTFAHLPFLTTLDFRLFCYNDTDVFNSSIAISTHISRILHHLGSQKHCSIEKLTFGTDSCTIPISNSMINAAASISSLRNIQIYRNYEDDIEMESAISEQNEENPNIHHDDTHGHCPLFTPEGIVNFLTKLQQNTRIEVIHFQDTKNLLDEAFKVLGQIRTLRELYLFDCSCISKTSIRYLLEQGISQQNFKKLVIGGADQKWDDKPSCMHYLLKPEFRFRQVVYEDDHYIMDRFIVQN
ncbi:hypothetical protein BDC45DRAFT_529613 [Circinella umbellata]|nr:hypothetical protein BDC45DRAFT_529613 [Circinella umbellata]